MKYSAEKKRHLKLRRAALFFVGVALVVLAVTVGLPYVIDREPSTIEEKITARLSYDSSVSESEVKLIEKSITDSQVSIDVPVKASVETSTKLTGTQIVEAYVPVTNIYSLRQKVSATEIAGLQLLMPQSTDSLVKEAIASVLGITVTNIMDTPEDLYLLEDNDIALIPASQLTAETKLLSFEDSYYLDSFTSGAVFRELKFSGEGSASFSSLVMSNMLDKESVFKANITGVTALTREMQRKLTAVGDPLYFSAKIGDFLSDADLTHVSNEVSFKPDCGYSATLFCSPPEFIETLKASGVDVVELTGNHNNDVGSVFNTETINSYTSLGWGTVGGGLNTVDAAKPFTTSQKGSNLTILAYNYPDSPNGGAIAGPESAGANVFDFTQIEADITAAKQSSDFVQVNVQYWECYAYPEGYIEFPECDKPIGEQESVFKNIIDLGADMVVGSSAHQPQTYEIYKGKAIYYGLGNLYFDQYYWPGTERGIIVTNYFNDGQLIQTKLTGTVYDREFQTRVMTNEESEYLFTRLNAAR